MSVEQFITKSGKVLTDADIEALADEAERGYDVSQLRVREPAISVEALGDWLVDNGYAEAQRGYGHATGEEIAEALLSRFRITIKT
jgi:hypothetical protein